MSTISAGTTSTTTLIHSGDTTGSLVLKTNDTGSGGTTAVTIGTDQSFNFSATGQRITGDFSNATPANRVAFQTSTTNGNTSLEVLTNGTSVQSGISFANSSDLANNSLGQVLINSTEFRFNSNLRGTGTYLPMTFYTGGGERMRVDTSGNVGIGTSSPAVKLDINGITGWAGATTGQTAQIVGASSGIGGGGNFRVLSNTTQAVDVGGVLTLGGYYTTTTASVDFASILGAKENSTGGNTAGYLAFGTRPNAGNMTERMRIDSSGYLWIKSTGGTSPWDATSGTYAKFGDIYPIGATAQSSIVAIFNRNTTTGSLVECKYNGAVVGSISVTASNTAYNTSSDYRLKHNIAPMTGALAKVSALNPVTYKWNADNSDGEGFIAHELAEVVPQCVTGEKDAVDAEGNPIYQGIDTSFLVATLTAAIQEQQALIQQLQADVAALKGTS